MNPVDLEESFQKYIKDLPKYIPDGILDIDLVLLKELGLVTTEGKILDEDEESLTHSFYVLESPEKLTLFNQKFVVWIVPQIADDSPTTFSLIAINKGGTPHLEMVFSTAGIYNHSNLVLRILEKFLEQIEENEKEIDKYESL